MFKFMILFTAILAFANDFSQRQTIALERIATALEKIAANNCGTNIQNPVELPPYYTPPIPKNYPSRVGSRSLKAIPTTDVVVDTNEKCEETCKSTFDSYVLIEHCIKTRCELEK